MRVLESRRLKREREKVDDDTFTSFNQLSFKFLWKSMTLFTFSSHRLSLHFNLSSLYPGNVETPTFSFQQEKVSYTTGNLASLSLVTFYYIVNIVKKIRGLRRLRWEYFHFATSSALLSLLLSCTVLSSTVQIFVEHRQLHLLEALEQSTTHNQGTFGESSKRIFGKTTCKPKFNCKRKLYAVLMSFFTFCGESWTFTMNEPIVFQCI